MDFAEDVFACGPAPYYYMVVPEDDANDIKVPKEGRYLYSSKPGPSGAELDAAAIGVVLSISVTGCSQSTERTAQKPSPAAEASQLDPQRWRRPEPEMARRLDRLLGMNYRVDVDPSGGRLGVLRSKATKSMTGSGAVTVRLTQAPETTLSCPKGLGPPDRCTLQEDAASGMQIRRLTRVIGKLTIIRADAAAADGSMVQVAASNPGVRLESVHRSVGTRTIGEYP